MTNDAYREWGGVPIYPFGVAPSGFGALDSTNFAGNYPGYGYYGGGSYGNFWAGFAPGQQMSDDQLQKQLHHLLDTNPVTQHAEINAEVKDHVATLTGTVRQSQAKMVAEQIAWSVPGIDDVNNTIVLQGPRSAGQGQAAAGQGQASGGKKGSKAAAGSQTEAGKGA